MTTSRDDDKWRRATANGDNHLLVLATSPPPSNTIHQHHHLLATMSQTLSPPPPHAVHVTATITPPLASDSSMVHNLNGNNSNNAQTGECGRWYALGTIPTCRLKQAKCFWCISVKLQKCRWLSTYRKPNDSSHIQTHRLFTLHSTASNPQNTWCSQSVPLVTVPTLFPLLHSYLWSSLRSFPIPWPCLLSGDTGGSADASEYPRERLE
jgi:hypothetical protein